MENNLRILENELIKLGVGDVNLYIDMVLLKISSFNPRLDFSSEEIQIKNSSGNSVVILTESIAIKIFYNDEKYTNEYTNELEIIRLLNNDGYPHIVQLLDYENEYKMMVIEKLELIYQNNIIKEIYSNKRFIITLFIIVLLTINKLYQYGKYNEDFSYSNIGRSLRDSQIKIFDLGLGANLNEDENIVREDLFRCFNNFIEDILLLLKKSDKMELRGELQICIEIFKEKHCNKQEFQVGLRKRYIESFKDLDFSNMINTLEEC